MQSRYEPQFDDLLKVLRRQPTDRPVLFEFFMNEPLYERLAGRKPADGSELEGLKLRVDAFRAAGYGHVTAYACNMQFQTPEKHRAQTISLNDGVCITDTASFETYAWPDPDGYDYSALERIAPYLPDTMKIMAMGPGGVLENVIALTGYDNLCFMLYEQPELVRALFDAVGSRLVRYYEIAAAFNSVGILMSNDDWGFQTQTFLSLEHMRKYVFPWHKRIVEAAHRAGKPVILHSCGYLEDVMEDVITDMRYDAKHSFEDNILSVEKSYDRWGDRIALLGGIDMDFLVRAPIPAIRQRCRGMLERTKEKGGYALGSGNSIPEYVPYERFMAMVETAKEL